MAWCSSVCAAVTGLQLQSCWHCDCGRGENLVSPLNRARVNSGTTMAAMPLMRPKQMEVGEARDAKSRETRTRMQAILR